MFSKVARRWTLVAVGLVVLAGFFWVGYQMWRVNALLDEGLEEATALRAAVSTEDGRDTQASLDHLRDVTREADDRTHGLTWAFLTALPFVGDDAQAVQLVADVSSEVSVDALPGLLKAADQRSALAPRNGRVDVRAIEKLQRPLAKAERVLRSADERLRAQDADALLDRLEEPYRRLVGTVGDASGAVESASTAVQVLPAMLGADGPRNHLLVFQNNAEIRATGGLPGALSLLRANDGRLQMARQLTAGAFPELAQPVIPLTPAERAIYDLQLGTFFQDANFTPDFPRTAELMRARWTQTFPEELDGVLSFDPVGLSYILEATGPITVAGTELTAANVVDELLHGVYRRYEDPVEQDLFFGRAARAVFRAVSSDVSDPQALVNGLARAAAEGRLYAHLFDEEQQEELAGSAVAGELVTDPDAAPQVGVYLNDGTGSKMSYFLRYDVDVTPTYCTAGVQGLAGGMEMRSVAPPDASLLPPSITGDGKYGTPPGSMTVFVRLYGPVSGRIGEISADGRVFEEPEIIDQAGRPVATLAIQLDPGQVVDLRWRMVTGRGQTEDVDVSVSPGIEPEAESSVAASACA